MVNTAVTLLSAVVIEKAGRRLLLIVGMAGMLVNLALIGLLFHLHFSKNLPNAVTGWGVFSSTLIFIASFALSIGPIPWIIVPELFQS